MSEREREREREREMAIMDSLRRFVAHEPVIAACCLLVGVNGNFLYSLIFQLMLLCPKLYQNCIEFRFW